MNTRTYLEVTSADSFYGSTRWITVVTPTVRLTLYYSHDQRLAMAEALRPVVNDLHPAVDMEPRGPASRESRTDLYLYPRADGHIHANRRMDDVTLFVFDKDEHNGGLTISGSVVDMTRLTSVLVQGTAGSTGHQPPAGPHPFFNWLWLHS